MRHTPNDSLDLIVFTLELRSLFVFGVRKTTRLHPRLLAFFHILGLYKKKYFTRRCLGVRVT